MKTWKSKKKLKLTDHLQWFDANSDKRSNGGSIEWAQKSIESPHNFPSPTHSNRYSCHFISCLTNSCEPCLCSSEVTWLSAKMAPRISKDFIEEGLSDASLKSEIIFINCGRKPGTFQLFFLLLIIWRERAGCSKYVARLQEKQVCAPM